MSEEKKSFSSNLTAILVAISAVVGLGNIWKFPGMVGENGGSVFLLFYIL